MCSFPARSREKKTYDDFPSVKLPYQDILIIQTPTRHISGRSLSFNQESGQMKMPVFSQKNENENAGFKTEGSHSFPRGCSQVKS
jgi:hypothetical protein